MSLRHSCSYAPGLPGSCMITILFRTHPIRFAPHRYNVGHAPRSQAGKAIHFGSKTWALLPLIARITARATLSGSVGRGNFRPYGLPRRSKNAVRTTPGETTL